MVYFTGDTHGDYDFWKLRLLKEKVSLTRDDIVLILGDCGVVFFADEATRKEMIELYESVGATIIYIDGNHENFPLINTYPVTEIFKAKSHRISEHIFHIIRGEIMELAGHTFLCLGGACSTDKAYRIEGKSWWKEEEITDEDIQKALENAKRYDNKVDFILTHCIDTNIHFAAFHFYPDVCTNLLSQIDYAVEYRMWLFGHYHEDRFLTSKKVCFYDKIAYLDDSQDTLFTYLDLA